jgi:GNAT superfamily N-acetyltransferase
VHHLRHHTLADAEPISRILADGWRQAYGGFLTPEALGLRGDRAHRMGEITEFLRDEFNPKVEGILVAEDEAVDGFVHMILEDKANLGAAGHVSLLYVDPAAQRRGLGKLLLAGAADWFAARVTGPIVISAFERNPYRGFYDRMGGAVVLRRNFELEGQKLESVIYRWKSPAALRQAVGR